MTFSSISNKPSIRSKAPFRGGEHFPSGASDQARGPALPERGVLETTGDCPD